MDTVQLGVCRNPACSRAVSGEMLERYPGPGQYCPECGELLANAPEPNAAAPLSLEAYEDFQARMQAALPPTVTPSPWARRLLILAIVVVVAAGIAFAAVRAKAIGGGAGASIAVCPSSITERLAGDVVQAYAAKSGTRAARFSLANAGACDVRFAARTANDRDAVGYDGIVVIVNPQNPLAALSADHVRKIFTGSMTDWAQAGGERRAIAPVLPADDSDEVHALRATLLRDAAIGTKTRRLGTSADVVHAVASASGRGMIGVVAFSAAVPAKVLALAPSAPPSVLSIGDHRYPLAVSVTVDTQGSRHDPLAAALVQYARSDEAQSIVARDGLVAKKGY